MLTTTPKPYETKRPKPTTHDGSRPGYALPLTYFIDIAQGVMLRGAPFTALWLSFLVLAVYAVVVFSAAVLRLRRDLAPNVKQQVQSDPALEAPAAK